MSLPQQRFSELWKRLGARDDGGAVFERLRAAYDEKHRAYHTATHIAACLKIVDSSAVQRDEVELALWFHDAVYDTRRNDNEERSAQLALESMRGAGIADPVIARVGAMIRATADHKPTSQDGEVMLDIDLAILGAPPAAFDRYEEEIRREFSWVDDHAYRAARAGILRKLQDRGFVYNTSEMRGRFEKQARENLARSIARLTAGASSTSEPLDWSPSKEA